VEIVVVVKPAAEAAARWPDGFIEETYGVFGASPLQRPAQREPEFLLPLE
jgi:hypothetical protein